MTAGEYKKLRRSRGTQVSVAARLGVDLRTVQRRESGEVLISREAAVALRSLPPKK